MKSKFLVIFVIFTFIIGCSNQEYTIEVEKGKEAVLNKKFDIAVEAFSKALSIKPNSTEAESLLASAIEQKKYFEKEKLIMEIRSYVKKTMDIHTEFIELMGKAQTTKDVDRLHELLVKADFTPPKNVYEFHKSYVKFLEKMTKSAQLYVSGKENRNPENIQRATTELEDASEYFSDYKHNFNYFLQDKEISKSEVGWDF